MENVSKLIILWTICVSNTESKDLSQREKRFILPADTVTSTPSFPTPTTFPSPLPNRRYTTYTQTGRTSFFTGTSLMNSVKVQCPHKRSVGYHRVLLDDNLMQELYLKLIGNIDDNTFAGSLFDAETNFKHMITLPRNKTHNHHHGNNRKKSQFVRDLTTYQTWYDSVLKDLHSKNDTYNHSKTSADGSADQLDEILKRKEVTRQQLKQLLGIAHDIDEIKEFRLSNRRIKRDTIGAVQSRTEYCHQRGSPTGTGYLHMCSECAMTTQFPEDMFPRYTNEITCDESDCDCFQVQNTAHGKCRPIVKNIQMLKRRTDGCRMVIKNGQNVIVDDWEIYEQPLHVGCECMFKKNSLFARFIPKH